MTGRREFLRAAGGALATGFLAPGSPFSVPLAPLPVPALPSPDQRAWQDLEVGMFVHFAPNTWQDKEYDDRSTPLSALTPDVDTEQWADVAASLGARYVVLVAKHVGGFCLWQTDTSRYGVRQLSWKSGAGDVAADLSASCAKRGLGLGIYLSPRDDTFGAGGGGVCKTPEEQGTYNAIYRQQLTELLTRYGPITEIWFDGSIVVPVGDILTAHAPHAMIFQGPHATIRWVGNEDGFAPYPCWNGVARADAATGIATALHGDPAGDVWLPNEVDVSLRRPDWFWHTDNEKNVLSLDALLEIYYRSVGRGAQLLLNIPPDRTGHIAAADAARAAEFGAEVKRRFGKSVAETFGKGENVALDVEPAASVDHVILEEDIAAGERVRGYRLEGRTARGWVPLGTGTAIGHKRIHPVGPLTVTAIRLVVTDHAGSPQIRRIAAFSTGSAPPATWNAPAKIWADDQVAEFTKGPFDLDLTSKIKVAGQYRVRWVPEGGGEVKISGAELLLGDVIQFHMAQKAPLRNDVLILTIPGLGVTVRLRGEVQGAEKGVILLQRIAG